MNTIICRTITAACFALFTAFAYAQSETSRPAQGQGMALTGQVGSTEEGAMEGVVVSARKDGSTISISVVEVNGRVHALLSPLTEVQKRLLELWDLPPDLYEKVARGFPKAPSNTSEP